MTNIKTFQKLEKAFNFAIIREKTSNLQQIYVHRCHRLLCGFISCFIGPLVVLLHIYFECETIEEYADSFYALATIITCGGMCIIFVINGKLTFQFIDNIEMAIHTRKFVRFLFIMWFEIIHFLNLKKTTGTRQSQVSRKIYEEMNAFVEKWSYIIDLAFNKVSTASISVPCFVLSYFLYFATDLGQDAFILPFRVWWICLKIYSIFSTLILIITFYKVSIRI